MLVTTKTQMQAMKEKELRELVIVPLLQKMGLRDVFLYHGGSGELGKDVTAWRENEVGQRRNCAIVVKAGKTSGPAAKEVGRQIRQSLNSPFTDQSSGDVQRAHEVWVMTNGPIPKESQSGFRSELDGADNAKVTVVDGDKLWELWTKHFPVALLEALELAQEHLAEVQTDLEVEVTISKSGDVKTVALSERYPGQLEGNPIKISGRMTFPETEEGEKARDEYIRFIESGSSARIPSEFVSINFPELIEELFAKTVGAMPDDKFSIELGSLPSDLHYPISIEITSDDGNRVDLPFIDMVPVQTGTKEVTLNNADQAFPINVRQVINLEHRSFTLGFSRKPVPISVSLFLRYLRTVEALGKPGIARVVSVESGGVITEERIPGSNEERVPPDLLQLASDLDEIQRRVKVSLVLPYRDLTDSEDRVITVLRSILHHPIQTHPWQEMTLGAIGSAASTEELLAPFSGNKPYDVGKSESEEITLFDVVIPIGEVVTRVPNPVLTNGEEVRTTLGLAKEQVQVFLLFENVNDTVATVRYENWIDSSGDDHLE